jgi:hypothetical protein
MTVRALFVAVLALATWFGPTHGQRSTSALLPDSVAERLVEFHNRDVTTRFSGDARIGPGTSMRGDVASLGGTLTIEGRVEGDVVVINGDVVVLPGGTVGGSVTVAGGDAHVPDGAVIGLVSVYREPLRYRHLGDAITYVSAELEPGLAAGRDFPFGRTELRIAAFGAYNRAEGLPIAIGPRIRFGGSHPTSARVFLIIRTAAPSDLDRKRIGFETRAEQLVAPDMGLSLSARIYSVMTPIEQWTLSDREAALAAFVLRTDYRDHYERRGWSLHARLAQPGSSYTAELEFRDEKHDSAPNADPFAIFHSGRGWRPQPSAASGSYRSLIATGRYDTRNEAADPSAGWLIDAALEQGLGGDLTNHGSYDPDSARIITRAASASLLAGYVDVRRYARLSPYARVAFRAAMAGSVNGRALPTQRQRALGGEGTLPGYRLFEFDCGARDVTVIVNGSERHPAYGCDRMALVQLEYQAGFPFARRASEALGLGSSLGYLARWVAFFDAGRAWTESGSRAGRTGGGSDFNADAGLGVRLGPLGAYWAVPLSGDGHGFNLFLRLGPRI